MTTASAQMSSLGPWYEFLYPRRARATKYQVATSRTQVNYDSKKLVLLQSLREGEKRCQGGRGVWMREYLDEI